LDLAEARRLISEAGYRPYVRKVRGKEYITLKRGSREVSVGPFSQDVWESLQSEWTIAVYGTKAHASKAPPQSQEPKPKLSEFDAALVFEWLDAGHDPVRVVRETRLHPDVVEYATRRYMELKKLNPRAISELTDTVNRVLNEVFVPLAENIHACAEFRQRSCRNFDGEACKLGWDASTIEAVGSGKIKPFKVDGELRGFWGEKYLRIKPTPLWCLACPFFERKY